MLINKVNTIFPVMFFIIFCTLRDIFSFALIICNEFSRPAGPYQPSLLIQIVFLILLFRLLFHKSLNAVICFRITV